MSTTESSTYTPDIPSEPVTKTTATIHIELTPNDLDSLAATRFVRSPSAGATVLFIGTTRDSFNNKAVSSLSYTSYAPLAMSTLFKIANSTSSHLHPPPFIQLPSLLPFTYLPHQPCSKSTPSPKSQSSTNSASAPSARRASSSPSAQSIARRRGWRAKRRWS
jgi:hypothetical protein